MVRKLAVLALLFCSGVCFADAPTCSRVTLECYLTTGMSNCWGCGQVTFQVWEDSAVAASPGNTCLYCQDLTCTNECQLCTLYTVTIVESCPPGGPEYETRYAYICCANCG